MRVTQLRCSVGGTKPDLRLPTVSRKKLRLADQLPDLAAGHLQGPERTVTQRTDHLLSLVPLLKQTRWPERSRSLERSGCGSRADPRGAVEGACGRGARGASGAGRPPARDGL